MVETNTNGILATTTDPLHGHGETQPHWYAVYTCSNREKKVAAQISRCGIDNYLPTYRAARRWSDRRIQLDMPLFQGYLFVHFDLSDRLKVLQIPGVVRLVGFGGLPAPLRDEQVESLRSGLNGALRVEPHPFLIVGRRVRIKRGPLAGLTGVLLKRKRQFRVVISVPLIQRAMVIDTDEADIEAL